ncbi:unnamed protein product [Effrenium voratum]|nr:unnamed protein product [Effrenium voratum]
MLSPAPTELDSDSDAKPAEPVPVDSDSDAELVLPPQREVAAPATGRQTSLLHWAGGQSGKKPKLGSVEMRKRRKERRELAADLRAGVLPLPPPVVGYDVQVERLCSSHKVADLELFFPRSPLASQLQLMSAACVALGDPRPRAALLESPTGTGKTLALLSSVLAFQQKCFRSWQEGGGVLPPAPAIKSMRPGEELTTPVPRVVWIARTHDQLLGWPSLYSTPGIFELQTLLAQIKPRIEFRDMTKLLALLVLPALAQKRHATVVGGDLVKGPAGRWEKCAGKMTHGGKLHHYAGVLQAMNPALGKSEMVLECCGESASLASTVALGINTNQLTGDVKESIVPEFTGKNMCTEKDGDHHTASEKCSYVYAFQNKQWKDNSLTAICVPSDVCSVDVVGMTKGTKIGYSLVSQILNRNAGDLMYAGQGNINACHQAQMDVNNGISPCNQGILQVYKNKYWDSEKGEINIAKFDAAIMEQKMKEKAAEDAKLAEEEVKSAEIEAKKLGLIKEEPKEEAAPEETKAPEKVGGGCDPNSKSSGCQRIDASADEAELTPMEKVAAVSEAAAKAEEEVKEAEETGTDPTEAATKALDAAVEKAEAAKVEAEEEVVSGILGAKDPILNEELPIMDAVQPPPVVTTKLEVNADVKGQADKMAADMTAAQEKASAAAKAAAEKMAADMKATQEQMEAAAKATAEKLAAHTGAVQKAAADHDVATFTADQATAAQDNVKQAVEALPQATIQSRRMSAVLI